VYAISLACVLKMELDGSMAQSPNSLQEPSMDELLASIREIIEESSAAAEGEDFSPVDQLADDKIADALAMAATGVTGGGVGADLGGEQDLGSQEDALAQAATPIHDAMKALAARIGLKKQAVAEGATAEKLPSPFTPQPTVVPAASTPSISAPISAAAPVTALPPAITPSARASTSAPPISSPLPASKMAEAVSPKPAASSSEPQIRMGQAKPPKFQAPASPQISSPIPLSLSVQASTQPQAARKKMKPHTVPPAPPPTPSLAKTPVKEALSVGHVPLYPQFRALSSSQQGASSPQAGQQAGMEAVSAQAPTSSAPDYQVSKREETMSQEQEQKLNTLPEGFLGEFEQSAELLLRPYIASWLEEHFQNLLEKILREEIQRLMKKSLQR